MTTPTEFALAALRRVAERYVAFCYQAGIAADAASLDPTEQLHAQALSALARVRVLDAERRAPSPVEAPREKACCWVNDRVEGHHHVDCPKAAPPVEAGPSAKTGEGTVILCGAPSSVGHHCRLSHGHTPPHRDKHGNEWSIEPAPSPAPPQACPECGSRSGEGVASETLPSGRVLVYDCPKCGTGKRK